MFEKYVDRLLSQYLAPYINGISQTSGVSRFRGEALYSNLSLKAEAFEFLKRFGIEISSSSLTSLAIKIPWSALTTARITIELDTLEINLVQTEIKDVPKLEDLLAEFRASKQQKIAAKVEEIQELEKLKEQESSSSSGGIVNKVVHRILQKLVVTLAGGVVLRMSDAKNNLIYGILLGSFGIHSRDDAVTDTSKFLKRCEILDLSAFVQVGNAPLRYMFTPTNLRLDVDHVQNRLDAKLEILHSGSHSVLTSGMLTVSRTALRNIMISVQELLAWQSFLEDLVKSTCRHIQVDSESLKGDVRKQYTALYRQKQMQDEQMQQTDLGILQAIEDAVPSRHVALWRIEVAQQIKIKRARTEKHIAQKGEASKSWFTSNKENHDINSVAPSEDEWADIIQTVEQQQEALVDVITPDSKSVAMTLARIGFNLYEDAAGSSDQVSAGGSIWNSESRYMSVYTYDELRVRLNEYNIGDNMRHTLQLLIEDIRADMGTTLKVHSGSEHYEWNFGVKFGVIAATCDQDTILQYEANDSCLKASLQDKLARSGGKHVALCSRFQENGSELITTAIKLPPVYLNVSPDMIMLIQKLIQVNLPPPPTFEKHEVVDDILLCSSGAVQLDLEQMPPSPTTGNRTVEQVTEWQDWRDEQQEKLMETAFQEFERVKQSTLTFQFDIFISAPQFKIALDGGRRVHINLGHLRCISEEEVTADNFNVQIDLTNTQIQCVSNLCEDSFCYSVLEPISLEICLVGKTDKGKSPPSGKAHPLDVTASAKLQLLQVKINPQCSQLLLKLADTYKELLMSDSQTSSDASQDVVESVGARGSRRTSLTSEVGVCSSLSTCTNAAVEPKTVIVAGTEQQAKKKKVNVSAAVAVTGVCLSLIDIKQDEIARIDMKELQGNAQKTPGNISCALNLCDLSVFVAGRSFITLSTIETTSVNALDLKIDNPKGGSIKVSSIMCPIVVSWRKEDVAALLCVVETCVPTRNDVQNSWNGSPAEARRDSMTGPGLASRGTHRLRNPTAFSIGPESLALASVGLDRTSEFPELQAENEQNDDAHSVALYQIDLYFGGVEFNVFVRYAEIERICPAWCSDAILSGEPLFSLKASVVRFRVDQFRNEENSGHISLDRLSLDYGGDCIISPWRSDMAVFECDFRCYIPAEKGGPAHSVCIKALIRRIYIIFLMRHLDSLLFNLSDNILGALVKQAAAQAVEVAAEAQTTSVFLWNCFMESPVMQCSRDVSVLVHSSDWGSGKCLPPMSTSCELIDEISRIVDASDEHQSERGNSFDFGLQAGSDSNRHESREQAPDDDVRKSTRSTMPSFDQCLLLMPGTIQAHCAYELESWQPWFVFAFRNCHIAAVDCSGFATGSICERFDWDLTVRPESAESQTGPLQISIGVHVNAISVTLSQSQFVLLLDIINENWAYSRYFFFEVASAPHGAEAAIVPMFASYLRGGDDPIDDALSESSISEDSHPLNVDQRFESTILNARLEFESIHLTATYARRTEVSGVDAEHVPLICIGVKNVRMTYDMVMYYDGKDFLFSYGFFVNSVTAEDFRPEDFRKSAYANVITCKANNDFEAVADDSWKLIVNCEEGRTPWKPRNAAFYLTLATKTGSHYVLTLKLEKPRIYCLVQLIVDAVMWVVNAFVASSIVQYGGAVQPDELGQCYEQREPEQADPFIFTFNFEINYLVLLFPTDPEVLTAGVIEVETTWRISLDYDFYSMRLKQFRATDTMIRRTEGLTTLEMPDRSVVQLIKLSYVDVVLEYVMGQKPWLNMIVCSMPISVRLSFGDVPHIMMVATNIGKDGRRGPMSELFSLDRVDDAETDEIEAVGAAEDATDTGILGSCGTLRLRVLEVSGVCAPGQLPELGCHSDCGVWVDAKFDGVANSTMAPWGKLIKLPVPVSASKFGWGAGSVPYDRDLMVELTLHRGLRGKSERLGVLAFPLNLCADHHGFKARRLMRSTSAKHSLFLAMKGSGQLELEFEAHFEARYGGMVTAIANNVPAQSLDDFLQSVPQLDDFLGAPVPQGPIGSFSAWRGRRGSLQSQRTLSSTRNEKRSSLSMPLVGGVATLAVRIFVTVESLEGLFLDDCRAKALPVLRFHVGLQSNLLKSLNLKDDSSQVLLDALGKEGVGGLLIQVDPWEQSGCRQNKLLSLRAEECTAGVQYLNVNAGCWEPVLESWTFDLFCNASDDPLQGRANASSANNPSNLEVSLVSFSPLLINVTPPLCSLAAWLLNHKEVYLAEFRGEGKGSNAYNTCSSGGNTLHEAGDHRYRLWNLTGEEVRLALFRPGFEQALYGQDPLKPAMDLQSEEISKKVIGQLERKYNALSWQAFQPSWNEVGLDSLLGKRTVEDWRESAAEAVGCAIEFAADASDAFEESAPSTLQMERRRLILPISSSCEGVLPLPRSGISAVCEVLAPHPSYHLLLISSGLRIFNHTDRRLEVRFQESAESGGMPLQNMNAKQVPYAAPLSILPEKVAFPAHITAAMRLPSKQKADSFAQKSLQSEDIQMQFMTKRSTTAKIRGMSSVPECTEDISEDAQRLEPQHFCAAPPVVAGSCSVVQFRLPGQKTWSNNIEVTAGEEPCSDVEVIMRSGEAVMRFRACTIYSSLSSVGHTTSIHIYSPLRILNATPLKMVFTFDTFEEDCTMENTTYVPSVTVEPWSDYDLPPQLDPAEAYSLSLSLADQRLCATGPQRARPVSVPRIFDTSGQIEELATMPISGPSEFDVQETPSIFFTVTRGLTCLVTVNRLLIDRTPLGLRVLYLQQKPMQDSRALPQVQNKLTLLCPIPQKHFRSASDLRRMRYYLALPQNVDGLHGWSTIGSVNFPEVIGEVSYVSLSRQKEIVDASHAYPVHVCLHSEELNGQFALGASCQIISVLPQVMIFNQVPDDAIIIRARGDAYTEVSIMPKSSAQFLQWRPHAETKKGSRARLRLEFRPSLLVDCANWSKSVRIKELGVQQVVLSAVKGSVALPNIMRLYLVEVVERNGVVCVTINRGSKCELKNFSSIVQTVIIKPNMEKKKHKVDESFKQITSWLPFHEEEEENAFSARPCETVDFAWPSMGNELQVRLVVQWSKVAGGSSTACNIADVHKPGESLVRAPGGWHMVVIETGRTGDISWVRLRDVPFQMAEPLVGGYSTISKMVLGTFVAGGEEKEKKVSKLRVGVSLTSVGVSLVSQHSERELMYAEVQDVGIFVGVWTDTLQVEGMITRMQVDSQLLDSDQVPVLLVSRGEKGVPALGVTLTQRLPMSRYVIHLNQMGIQTDAIEVNINDRFLMQAKDTINYLLNLLSVSHGITRDQLESWHGNGTERVAPPAVPTEIVCEELIFLGLEVFLWAHMTPPDSWPALRQIFHFCTAGADSLEVKGARLRFDSEVFDKVSGAAPDIAKTLRDRYALCFAKSLCSILGRSTLATIPALPIAWGRKGMSEAIHAVDGLLHRTFDVFEMLTLDQQYIRRKRRQRQQRRKEITGLRSGLSTAALHLGAGLMHITDIIREPIAGAKQNGWKGFAIGLGRGLVGTAVKPIVEIGSSARSMTHAIRIKIRGRPRDSDRHVTMRLRPPRVMYSGGGIREYDEAAALLTLEVATASPVVGSSKLDCATIEQARFSITDHVVVMRSGATPYIKHLLLLLTATQLLLVDLDAAGIALRWSVSLANFCGAQASSHGVIVWAWNAFTDSNSPEDRIGHQVPSARVDVIQSVLRMLQLLQPQGGRRRTVIEPTRVTKNIPA